MTKVFGFQIFITNVSQNWVQKPHKNVIHLQSIDPLITTNGKQWLNHLKSFWSGNGSSGSCRWVGQTSDPTPGFTDLLAVPKPNNWCPATDSFWSGPAAQSLMTTCFRPVILDISSISWYRGSYFRPTPNISAFAIPLKTTTSTPFPI